MPRYFACKYGRSHTDASTTDDGLCFVQSVLKDGAISGRASASEVGHAAFTVLQTCVIERGMGGMAFDIGEWSKTQAITGLATQSPKPLEAQLDCEHRKSESGFNGSETLKRL